MCFVSVDLVWDSNESAYRQEGEQLALWCNQNNLELNALKTVEMIVTWVVQQVERVPLWMSPYCSSMGSSPACMLYCTSTHLSPLSLFLSLSNKAKMPFFFFFECGDGSALQDELRGFIQVELPSGRYLRNCWCSSTPVSSLHIHQTTMGSQDCRKNRWCQPALLSGNIIHLLSKDTGLLHHCRPSYLGHKLFQLFSAGRRYRPL